METTAPALLSHWEGFCVIVGTSAAALTGLMFVVITLIADARVPRSLNDINAYATPTVVHFTAVLTIAAILGAPWPHLRTPAYLIDLLASAGVIYTLIVLLRLRRPSFYKKVWEDWIWHVILPMGSYIVLLMGGLGLWHHYGWAPYAIGAAALTLLFIGIHNAWDTVAYMVATRRNSEGGS